MTTLQWILVIGGGTALTITLIAALIRAIIGPTVLDRMIASDVFLTTVVLGLGGDMVIRQHTDSITLMTAIAATAVFGTITVARHVHRTDGPEPVGPITQPGEPGPEDAAHATEEAR
ncbi:sodium:proton antiporter [Leucobacter sp. HNU]|uniref:sodium:proton antiporter n=1 Tax=Leucobacter sp. HNU TaxID=3236805 RepID=UPI003A807C9D